MCRRRGGRPSAGRRPEASSVRRETSQHQRAQARPALGGRSIPQSWKQGRQGRESHPVLSHILENETTSLGVGGWGPSTNHRGHSAQRVGEKCQCLRQRERERGRNPCSHFPGKNRSERSGSQSASSTSPHNPAHSRNSIIQLAFPAKPMLEYGS